MYIYIYIYVYGCLFLVCIIDRKVPLRFGGIEFDTGRLISILEGSMLVLGCREGAGVEFNPSPGNKNQEPRFPEKCCGNLGSWFLVPGGDPEFWILVILGRI